MSRLDLRLDPAPLPYASAQADRIGAHWRRAFADNPALFDGPVLLFSGLRVADGVLGATAHRTGFSALLALIADGDPAGEATNVFGAAAIVSSDGAVLLGVMGPHTAFPGLVKLVSGTPDLTDVAPDGIVDLEGSIRRELGEETGLDAAEAVADPELLVVREGSLVAVAAVLRFEETADRLLERIRAFLAADPEPELSDVVAVRADGLDDARMPAYTRAVAADILARRAL